MNEIVFQSNKKRWSGKRLLKRLIWSAARPCALGGMFAWRLEEHWLRIERRPMLLSGLGEEFAGMKLAHVSDLHCSPIVLEKYLHQCVDAINALDADFVALTGDYVTGPMHYARRVAKVLKRLRPKVAAVACLGNHDYGLWHPRGLGGTRGMSQYITELLTRADVFVLANEARTFRHGRSALQFVGLEDIWSGRFDPERAFEMIDPSHPVIALCHNPDAAAKVAVWGAQWVLAGHTHGAPTPNTRFHNLVLPTRHKHFAAGEYCLGDGRKLYITRGLGYARRMNLNARPEITLFTLQPSAVASVAV